MVRTHTQGATDKVNSPPADTTGRRRSLPPCGKRAAEPGTVWTGRADENRAQGYSPPLPP
ncbi:hypothetical protein GCM10010182_64060 [Actinomadura cremea]|nr:hypothetical protein GCM10010182_64060 [Actinomadura cremea]